MEMHDIDLKLFTYVSRLRFVIVIIIYLRYPAGEYSQYDGQRGTGGSIISYD